MRHHTVSSGAQQATLPRRGRSAHRQPTQPVRGHRWRIGGPVVAALIGATVAAGQSWAALPAADVSSSGTLVDDAMARTVTGGWGAATVGGPYTLSSPRAGAVRPGGATLTVPVAGTSVSATLTQVKALDSTTSTNFSLDEVPTVGGGVYTSLLLRRQPNRDGYRAKVRVLPGGEVRLSFSRIHADVESAVGGEDRTGLLLAAHQQLNLQVEISGSAPVTLRSRVWLGGAAPDWQQTVMDTDVNKVTAPGSSGLMVYLSAGSQAPAAVTFGRLGAGGLPAVASGPTTTPVVATPPAAPVLDPAPPTSPAAGPPGAGTGTSGSAGSVPVGSATYPMPADALVVSPSGNDSAVGSAGAPLQTVARAIAVATSGRTIVLRGGSYHESVKIPPNKQLTIQPFPGEQVWFDGSSPVTGWAQSGTSWVKTGWTTQFDSTPCYNAGSCNNPNPDFQFVGSDFPMAAHPDQVWIGATALRQVDSLAHLTTGSFFVDYPSSQLYIGSDPTGQEVRASDLTDAIWVQSAGSTVRGIGVHRYGTPLPGLGTVKADGVGVTLENMVVSDNATEGIGAFKSNITLRHLTVDRNGILGIHANAAYGLKVDSVEASGNNSEHFKQAPVSGGIKITRSRGVSVVNSVFADNIGPGVWFDESVYDITLTRNLIARNAGHGVALELSAKAVVAENRIFDNGRIGLKINNTNGVDVWNNTFVGNAANTVHVVQDSRLASNPATPGHDRLQPVPDPTVTWVAGSVTVSDNIFSHAAGSSPCVLCVQDATHQRTAEQMDVIANGNVYNRVSATSPAALVAWSTGAGVQNFPSLPAFQAATGQDTASVAVDGPSVVDGNGKLVSSLPATVAQPLPAAVAATVGLPAGTRQVGAAGG